MNTAPYILVVDDDLGGRRLTRAALAKAGFQAREAADGRMAVDAVQAEIPALILMDVGMPVMDGFTACAEIRRIPGASQIPLIMMTGLDDIQSIERAFDVGATDFITKPINWLILGHRVRYMLRASAAIDGLKQSQRRLSNAQRIGLMGDWEWDVRDDRIVLSEQAWHILGQTVDTSRPGTDLAGLLLTCHPDDRDRLRSSIETISRSGEVLAIDHRVVWSDGQLRYVHQQIEILESDASGSPVKLAGALYDITQHKLAEAEIRRLAYYDPLTGLPNRLLFMEQLGKAISHATRHGLCIAIMFIDLDNFKRVNDTLGHGAGDELLRRVSVKLSSSVRSGDLLVRSGEDVWPQTLARLGGDEFIVMLSDLGSSADAASVARRLVAALAEPVTLLDQEVFVGGSVGIALYPDDGTDAETLLMNADTAMYRAKDAGRGGFQFYDQSMNARALEQLVLEAELRRALERGEFVLHYQPRIEVSSGRVVGAEALMRWNHPERGLVPPGEFIPLAERCGLIIALGEWAIREVCRQCAAWQAGGMPELPVAVNLAATHLRERGLPDLVADAVRHHGLRPTCLQIEVTESLLVTEPELSLEIAHRLSAMGVHLSIDDFGTGYSSLSYLKRLPIQSVKIDRSFICDLVTDPDDAAITTAIIAMAHSLKLLVVAEGVESEEQLGFLQARQCDEYQGFLATRALPPQEFARFVCKVEA